MPVTDWNGWCSRYRDRARDAQIHPLAVGLGSRRVFPNCSRRTAAVSTTPGWASFEGCDKDINANDTPSIAPLPFWPIDLWQLPGTRHDAVKSCTTGSESWGGRGSRSVREAFSSKIFTAGRQCREQLPRLAARGRRAAEGRMKLGMDANGKPGPPPPPGRPRRTPRCARSRAGSSRSATSRRSPTR